MDAVAARWRERGGRRGRAGAGAARRSSRASTRRPFLDDARVGGRARASMLDPDTFTSPESWDDRAARRGRRDRRRSTRCWTAGPRGRAALVRPPGHHASRDRRDGLLPGQQRRPSRPRTRWRAALARVAIVDFDVHHGNGTQEIFEADPRVLFVSTHQWPFYPGTGAADEVGTGAGDGFTVNVPLRAPAPPTRTTTSSSARSSCRSSTQFDPELRARLGRVRRARARSARRACGMSDGGLRRADAASSCAVADRVLRRAGSCWSPRAATTCRRSRRRWTRSPGGAGRRRAPSAGEARRARAAGDVRRGAARGATQARAVQARVTGVGYNRQDMSEYKPQAIEQKWQQRWATAAPSRSTEDPSKPKFYCLEMFAYPSGHAHVGHVRNYMIGDVMARMKRMRGFNVLHPFGWDAFGLPAENAAIKNGIHPETSTLGNIAHMKGQLQRLGISYAWERETRHVPAGLLPVEPVAVPADVRARPGVPQALDRQLVLVVPDRARQRAGRRRRLLALRTRRSTTRDLEQWFLRITHYADELLQRHRRPDGLAREGPDDAAELDRAVRRRARPVPAGRPDRRGRSADIEVFTTRIDTIFGATFVLLAPEHELVERLAAESADPAAIRERRRPVPARRTAARG